MNKKMLLRKAHRFIGLFASLQLLAWTLGGIWFSWNNIDKIHGDHLRNSPDYTINSKPLISPQIVFDSLADFKSLDNLSVMQINNNTYYRLKYLTNDYKDKEILIDAVSGITQNRITKEKAILIAKKHANFNAEIINTELITETSAHHEYRGKNLPAWAITFNYSGSPTFYVSANYGTVNAVRHNSWRIFDFLWMLHTMDFMGRDDFNNWLIKVFSIIALITSLSGVILFFISRKKQRL